MPWLVLRVALALFLLTRRRSGRFTLLVAGLLLPAPLRTIANAAFIGRVAWRGMGRRRAENQAATR